MNMDEIRSLRRQMISECESNPHFRHGKRIIFIALVLFVTARAISASFQLLYLLMNGGSRGSDIMLIVFTVLIALAFCWLVSAGTKGAAYLAVFGGVYSMFSAYMNGAFFGFATDDVLLNANNIALVTSIFIQIVTMTVISMERRSNVYMKLMAEVQKEIINRIKR